MVAAIIALIRYRDRQGRNNLCKPKKSAQNPHPPSSGPQTPSRTH
jgi:hypothetical protein